MVDAAKLLEVLERVKYTVAKDPPILVFSTVCFGEEDIRTFDGIAGTIVRESLGFTGCVDFVKLYKMAKLLTGEITVEETKDSLKFSCDNFSTTIRVLPVLDFPDIAPQSPSKYYEGEGILEAFTYLSKWMLVKDEPKLEGVAIKGNRAYATTKRTVNRVQLPAQAYASAHLPASFIKQVVSLGTPEYLFRDGPRIGAKYPGCSVITRVMSASYPFSQLEEMFTSQRLYAVDDEVTSAVKTVLIFCDTSQDISLKAENGELTVSGGGATQTLATVWPDMDIKVDGKMFLKCLAAHSMIGFDSDRVVTFDDPTLGAEQVMGMN